MKGIFFSCVVFFIISCSDYDNKSGLKTIIKPINQDSLKLLSLAITAINEDEKSSEDSIKKYHLDSLNDRCKNIIYTLYGSDTLNGNQNNESITIGECNVRLIEFTNGELDFFKVLRYGIFVQDSIPIIWRFRTDLIEKMVLTFVVNLTDKKIVKTKISEFSQINFKDIEYSYDTVKRSYKFKNYIFKYKHKLHNNFKVL